MTDPRWYAVRSPHVVPGRANVAVWVLACAAGIAVAALAASLGVTVSGIPVVAALLFGLVQGAAVPAALVVPVPAVAAALVAGVALTGLAPAGTTAPWPVAVTTVIAFGLTWIVAGARTRWFVAASGWGTSVLCALMVVDGAGAAGSTGPTIANLVVFASTTLACVGVGVVLRNWSEVRAQLVVERAATLVELARRESAEDKARIARELHDVVAHGMSAIQVRAASARYRLPDLTAEAAAEFDDLAATARASMTEMRAILGVLRDEDAAAERAPMPTLADLDAVIARARDLGPVAVDGAWSLPPAEAADDAFGLVVFRVVQEALSNVARHAPGAASAVIWSETPDALALEVRNASPARPAAPGHPERGGQGLRGMRERVQALGGTVEAGPSADGGFSVRVLLPRRTDAGRKAR